MPATPNPIDVVERAYDLESAPRQWLDTITRMVLPLLDSGLGVMAYFYDLRTTPLQWLDEALLFDIHNYPALRNMMGTYNRSDIDQFQIAPAPLDTIGEVSKRVGVMDPREHPEFSKYIHELGARDMAAFRTVAPGGRGIVVCAPQRDNRQFDRRTKSLWAKVAAHLAAGHRLRDRLATESFEAVLTPSGKLEHAEGDSRSASTREALRTAVLRQEKARGRARRQDPEGATDMWTALVSGRWSLVDHFVTGGRRYIVARRNEHGGSDPRALAERERTVAQLAALGKSNKLIAYELGISESTVGSHLSSAMRKLRVKTRVELLRLLMQMAQPSS